MAFRVGYEKLLTIYCWHPAFLGAAAGWPARPARTPVTDATVENDLLGYDFRTLARLEPTPDCERDLRRHGLRFRRSTTGGWVVGPQAYVTGPATPRLRLGLYAQSPDFVLDTNFHRSDVTRGQLLALTDDGLPAGAAGEVLLLSGGDFSGNYREYTPREALSLRPGVLALIDLPIHGRRGQAFDLLFSSPPVLNP